MGVTKRIRGGRPGAPVVGKAGTAAPAAKPAVKPISQLAYAKHRGVTHHAVQKAIKSGRLNRSVRDGKIINVALADKEWADNSDERKVRVKSISGDGERGTFQQANTDHAMYKAKLLKLEHDKRIGLLISVDEVKVIMFNASRKVRDGLQSLPERLAAIVADRPRDEVYPLLKKEIDQALTEFADRMAMMG